MHFKCCNTCEEVREAYRLKGWALQDPSKVVQCKGMVEEMKAIFNEGCKLYGYYTYSRLVFWKRIGLKLSKISNCNSL
jgi:hypothetical protein